MHLLNDLRPFNTDGTGGPLLGMLVIYLVGAAALALIPAVMSDSLGNHQAFYRTRPIRLREIVTAKILFLFIWIVIPACMTETVYLVYHSLPASFIAAAIGERFLYLVVFGVAIGAAATSFPSTNAALKNYLSCVPIPFAGAYVWAWTGSKLNLPELTPSVASPIGLLFMGLTIAIGCSLYVWRATSRSDAWFYRWLPIAGLAFIVPLFSANWQSNLGGTKPHNPIALDTVSISPTGMKVTAFDHSADPAKAQVQISLSPTSVVDPGSVVEWAITDMTLKDSLSRRQSEGFRRPTGRIFNRRSHSSNRGQDIEAITSFLPRNVRFAHNPGGNWSLSQTVTASLATVRSPMTTDEPTHLQGEIRGRQFEWKLVGELAPREGSQLSSGQTEWRFLEIKRSHDTALDLKIEWSRPSLKLSQNQSWRSNNAGPLTRHEFLIYQEDDQLAFAAESVYQSQDIGMLSGYRRSVATLQFRQTSDPTFRVPSIDPSKAKILVFEKIFRNEVTLAWEKQNIRLAHQFQANSNNSLRPPEKLPRSEFEARLRKLGPVPIGSTRTQAGRYLYEVIKLVQARDQWIQPNDRLAIKLAPLAHEHPEMFLDGLRNAHHRAAQLLASTLQQGIAEDQKHLIIERLSRQPNLANLVLARNWIEPAREALITLAKERESLPISAIRSLVLLNESKVYEAILNDFQKHPTLEFYDALRTLPSIEEELNLRVQSIWNTRPKAFSHRHNSQSLYSIALRHGMREPIDEIFQILRWIEPKDYSQGYNISRAIQENVDLSEIPRYQRNDSSEVLAWLIKQKPEWFQYDPSRRLFYVKKA